MAGAIPNRFVEMNRLPSSRIDTKAKLGIPNYLAATSGCP
jgi:hypothetical protein